VQKTAQIKTRSHSQWVRVCGVSDGVGGKKNGGAVASQIAARAVEYFFAKSDEPTSSAAANDCDAEPF